MADERWRIAEVEGRTIYLSPDAAWLVDLLILSGVAGVGLEGGHVSMVDLDVSEPVPRGVVVTFRDAP